MFTCNPSKDEKLSVFSTEVVTFFAGQYLSRIPVNVDHKISDGYVCITTDYYTENKPGYHAKVCEGCGEAHDAQPHEVNPDAWTSNNDATFMNNGTESTNCLVCNAVVTRNTFGTAGFNETFADYLDQLNTAFNALSPDEKEEFNAKVGTIYEKYKNLALIHQDGYVATDLGDWADEFSALEKACQTATEAYISAANYNVALSSLYIAYERANNIVNHIMKNAPSNVLYAFNYEPVLKYNVTQYDEDGNSETVTYNYTADLYFSNVRYYYNAMSSYVELHGYISANMSAFFDTAYDVTFGSLYLEGGQITQSDVLAVMSAFDALTLEDKDLFYFLDLSWSKKGPFYFYMLAEYFTDTMTENASKVAIELLVELEVTYVYAAYYGYPEDIVALETAVEHIKQTYGAMNSEDIASFEILQDRYDKCLEDCKKLLESYETEEE
jgi:hypothetical protein